MIQLPSLAGAEMGASGKNPESEGNGAKGQDQTHSFTITLPDYDHELRYVIHRQARAIVIEPKFDYKDEEFRYIVGRLFSQKRLAKQEKNQALPLIPQTLTERQAVADHFLEQIEQYRPSAVFRRGKPPPVLHWPDEVGHIVLDAFHTFGFDALRLSVADTLIARRHDTRALAHDYLASLDHLGAVIGEVIRDWQRRVQEEPDLDKRRQAQNNLRQVGKALIPNTRGKREKRVRVPDREVKRYYYKELFRCEQASTLLRRTATLPGCRRWEVRLQAVCERFDLPYDPGWWGFSEKGQVLRQLLMNAKESAVLLTARHFPPAKEQTIRNILAR